MTLSLDDIKRVFAQPELVYINQYEPNVRFVRWNNRDAAMEARRKMKYYGYKATCMLVVRCK